MDKYQKRLLFLAIILATFNVVVFVLSTEFTSVFWIGYIFTTISILIFGAAIFFISKNGEGYNSIFLKLPILKVAYRYLWFQLIWGLILIFLSSETIGEQTVSMIPPRVAFVISFVMLGVCLLFLISTKAGHDEIKRIDEKIKSKVFYIKSLQSEVELLEVKVENVDLKKALKALFESIKYSDSMSHESLSTIESNIEIGIKELKDLVEQCDIEKATEKCKQIGKYISERNSKCKILK